MRLIKSLIVILFTAITLSAAAIELEEGVHYDVVAAKSSEHKKVSEYFNYGCPGCFKSESLSKAIKAALPADATFEYVPFENNPSWRVYVEAFYIAEMLGLDKAHDAIFHQVHVEHKPITSQAQLKDLLVKLGADAKKFDQAASSFQLSSKLRLARKQAISHKIISTPTFVVNERYRINARAFESTQDLIDAIVTLLNR
jgi:thiol:disulfide interchange protein DsbA